MSDGGSRRLSTTLLAGFAVAATGGPLALGLLYLPHAATVPVAGLPATALLGAAVFAAPLAVYAVSADRVSTGGGQFDHVRTAAGPALAWIQGIIWSFAYLLYLPYTVTYVVYYLLPDFWRLTATQSALLELLLPAALSALVLVGPRAPVMVLAVFGGVQLAAVAVLAALVLGRAGFGVAAVPHATWVDPPAFGGVLPLALLFVCIHLTLFLGGEAGGGRNLRRALIASYGAAAAAAVLSAAFVAAGASAHALAADMPGVALVRARLGAAPGIGVGLLTLASVAAVIIAEYVALSRLWHAMFGWRIDRSILAIGVWFVAGDALSLLSPDRSYTLSLPPSLAALFVSQIIVFAAFPWFQRRTGRAHWALDAAALLAAAWAVYGLVSVVAGAGGS